MENPDAELVIERDKDGMVIKMSYKVTNAGEEGRRALEFCELASTMIQTESMTPTLNFNADVDVAVHE